MVRNLVGCHDASSYVKAEISLIICNWSVLVYLCRVQCIARQEGLSGAVCCSSRLIYYACALFL